MGGTDVAMLLEKIAHQNVFERQLIYKRDSYPPADSGLVAFRVDGERFEVLEQMIHAKGDTLLATLLDDPQHDAMPEICVEGNKQRFRYILDWYLYGSILLPHSISLAEMRRDCAFFQLPDDLPIQREQPTLMESLCCANRFYRTLKDIKQECVERQQSAQNEVAAMTLVQELLQKMQESLALAKGNEDVVLRIDNLFDDKNGLFHDTKMEAVVTAATEMLQKHGYVVKGEEKKHGIRRCAWIFRLTFKESTSMCDDLEDESIDRLDE